jgi:hypothetical protein
MPLLNTTPYDTVVNQFLANSNWYGNGTKAALRKEALDWILINRPTYGAGDDSVTMNYKALLQEQKDIADFLDSIDNTNRVSFTRGRLLTP